MENEAKFKAKCRELGVDPDIARKITSDNLDPLNTVVSSLQDFMKMAKFISRQCETMANALHAAQQAAAARAKPRRRKVR